MVPLLRRGDRKIIKFSRNWGYNEWITLTQATLKTMKKVWGSDRSVCRDYYIVRVPHNIYPKRIGRSRCRNNRRAPASPVAAESPSADWDCYHRWGRGVWVGLGAARAYWRLARDPPCDGAGERRVVCVEGEIWWGRCWKEGASGWNRNVLLSLSTAPPPSHYLGLGFVMNEAHNDQDWKLSF